MKFLLAEKMKYKARSLKAVRQKAQLHPFDFVSHYWYIIIFWKITLAQRLAASLWALHCPCSISQDKISPKMNMEFAKEATAFVLDHVFICMFKDERPFFYHL